MILDSHEELSIKERTITIPSDSKEEKFDGSLALPYLNRSIDICDKVNAAQWLLRDLIKIFSAFSRQSDDQARLKLQAA